MPKIELPTLLRAYAGDAPVVEVAGGTVGEALDALFEQHPDLRVRMIDRHGGIRSHVLGFVGDERIRRRQYADLPLEPDDTVTFLIAVAGG